MSEDNLAERRVVAWQNVFHGKNTPEQGKIVIAHLALLCGFYNVPSFEQWMEQCKTPLGFAEYCARREAQREIFATVLTHLNVAPESIAMGGTR